MTTTVYVPEDQIAPFKADCEAQEMGYSDNGVTTLKVGEQTLIEFHIWNNA